MSAAHKSESPAATGQFADKNNFDAILNTTKAKLQLAGFTVHSVEAGHLVCRWNLSRVCVDLGELRSFAKQVGVKL